MNFIFLKFFLIVCFSKTIICDSSVIIPLRVMLVNHKIQFFSFILFFYFVWGISLFLLQYDKIPAWGCWRTSHFPCGQRRGRPSQSSEARRNPALLGMEWALHLRCVTRLTFGCILRCLGWNVVPSWFLHTSHMWRWTIKKLLKMKCLISSCLLRFSESPDFCDHRCKYQIRQDSR